MNRAISLSKLIDEASYLQNESTKRLAGSITDPDNFVRNLPALQSLHTGLFSFIAFHPRVDQTIAEYIEKGSIASDSGPDILVLFFSATEMRFPRTIAPKDLNIGVNLDMEIHPAYQLTQSLFPTGTIPKFPGLIFFDSLFDEVEAVYVPIARRSTAAEVVDFCRSVFVLADRIMKQRNEGEAISFDSLSMAFKTNGIDYSRTGQTSVGEWLISAYNFGKKHSATIVSLISKIAKVV
jgi:hypothetical protein